MGIVMDWRPSMDWIPIKNQMNCSCCWAIVACTAIEVAYYRRHRMKLHLAVQELIDCTKPNPRREKEEKNFYDDAGCFSSTVNHAFRRIKAKGICSEEDYEFQARRGECQEEGKNNNISIVSYHTIPEENQEELMIAALDETPICASLNAERSEIKNIGWEIYMGPADPQEKLERHAVVIIGFGDEIKDGRLVNYWMYRSSWGSQWGNEGYGRVCRQSSLPANSPHLITRGSYPIVPEVN